MPMTVLKDSNRFKPCAIVYSTDTNCLSDYESEELRESPPEVPDMTQKITRSIMAEEPRVTRY